MLQVEVFGYKMGAQRVCSQIAQHAEENHYPQRQAYDDFEEAHASDQRQR
jgi:hypothetical protein